MLSAMATPAAALIQQLHQVRSRLIDLQRSGAGDLRIVPSATVSTPTVQIFDGTEYLAWPAPEYTLWYSAWKGAVASVGAFALKFPLGEGFEVMTAMQEAAPEKIYSVVKASTKLKLLPKVTHARGQFERGLSIIDPSFHVDAGWSPWTWAIGIGAIGVMIAATWTAMRELD